MRSPDLRESLLWGHEAALTEAFATGKAAVEACFDREPWDTPDMGALRMHRLDVPGLGAQSVAYYVGPGVPPGADPWLEMQVLSILVTGLDPIERPGRGHQPLGHHDPRSGRGTAWRCSTTRN